MKNIFHLIFLLTICSIYSCATTEEPHNHVTITVASPTNGGTVSDASAVSIDVTVAAAVELHDVELTLKDDASGNSISPFNPMDLHTHSKSKHIKETVNLSSYSAGSSFTLTIEACEDHDCAEKETETVKFSI